METETEEKVCLEIQNVKVQPSNWRAFSEDLKIDIGFNSSREIKGAYWKITVIKLLKDVLILVLH